MGVSGAPIPFLKRYLGETTLGPCYALLRTQLGFQSHTGFSQLCAVFRRLSLDHGFFPGMHIASACPIQVSNLRAGPYTYFVKVVLRVEKPFFASTG